MCVCVCTRNMTPVTTPLFFLLPASHGQLLLGVRGQEVEQGGDLLLLRLSAPR